MPNLSTDFQATLLRHQYVQHDGIVNVGPKSVQGLSAVTGQRDLESRLSQCVFDNVSESRVVIDDKDMVRRCDGTSSGPTAYGWPWRRPILGLGAGR